MAQKRKAKKRIVTKDYTPQHKKNIISENRGSKNTIEPGVIVRFNYTGIEVNEPRPLVLVLNPKWKNHLHGIALRILSESELLQLSKLVKFTIAQKANKLLKLRLPKLKADIGNPKSFYESKIKKFLGNKKEPAYRTYTLSGISNIKLIDYRFKDMDVKIQKSLAREEDRKKKI